MILILDILSPEDDFVIKSKRCAIVNMFLASLVLLFILRVRFNKLISHLNIIFGKLKT